ncbi:MAG: hypothetical protein JXN60_04055, partial [Lentisphaerae bacterium]|nr:hypothetical protein [Lentisphaerota bacterium]
VADGAAILQYLHTLPATRTFVLYPTTDYQVAYLSSQRANLPGNCLTLFPKQDLVDTLMHKERFDALCHASQFPVPATEHVRSSAEIRRVGQHLSFPVIAKTPLKAYKPGLSKAYILSDNDALIAWYDSVQHLHQEFVIQEYIPGPDGAVFFTMQYISANGTLLASFTGRKIRQWRPLSGGTASAEPYYNEFLTNLTYEFFRKAGFWGIGSMEYKQHAQTGEFHMIEPTVCRTDFQEGVAIANGVNIPLIAYQDITGQVVQPGFQKKNARKAWVHVLHERLSRDWYISQKDLTYFKWLVSLCHVRSFDAFSFRDPGPCVLTLRKKITNQGRKLFRKISHDKGKY